MDDLPQNPAQKVTLYDFVKENSTLITSMAAFIALAAFASQLSDNEAKTGLAGGALLAAVLLAIEIFFRVPLDNQHWRLKLFELIMLGIAFQIGRYFFLHFPAVWGPAVTVLLDMLIFVGPPLVLGSFTNWILRKRSKLPEQKRYAIAFYVFAGAFVVLFLLIQIKLSGHSIRIPIPKAVTNFFSLS